MIFDSISKVLRDTIHVDAIVADVASRSTKAISQCLDVCPFILTPVLEKVATRLGLPYSGFGVAVHSHALHKNIENHLLHNVVPNLVKKMGSSLTVLFMKKEKYDRFFSNIPGSLLNECIVARDVSRYFSSDSIGYIGTDVVFVHDALQNCSLEDLIFPLFFQTGNNVRTILATAVIPANLLCDAPDPEPQYYHTEKLSNGGYVYHLEDDGDSYYVQNKSSLDWLKLSRVHVEVSDQRTGSRLVKNAVIDVSLIQSYGSAHVFSFTLVEDDRRTIPEEIRSFYYPEAVALPSPVNVTCSLADSLVPKEVFDNLFFYIRGVRTLRVTDPVAKVHAFRQKKEFAWVKVSAWEALCSFAVDTASAEDPRKFKVCNYPRFWALVGWVKFFFLLALVVILLGISGFSFAFAVHNWTSCDNHGVLFGFRRAFWPLLKRNVLQWLFKDQRLDHWRAFFGVDLRAADRQQRLLSWYSTVFERDDHWTDYVPLFVTKKVYFYKGSLLHDASPGFGWRHLFVCLAVKNALSLILAMAGSQGFNLAIRIFLSIQVPAFIKWRNHHKTLHLERWHLSTHCTGVKRTIGIVGDISGCAPSFSGAPPSVVDNEPDLETKADNEDLENAEPQEEQQVSPGGDDLDEFCAESEQKASLDIEEEPAEDSMAGLEQEIFAPNTKYAYVKEESESSKTLFKKQPTAVQSAKQQEFTASNRDPVLKHVQSAVHMKEARSMFKELKWADKAGKWLTYRCAETGEKVDLGCLGTCLEEKGYDTRAFVSFIETSLPIAQRPNKGTGIEIVELASAFFSLGVLIHVAAGQDIELSSDDYLSTLVLYFKNNHWSLVDDDDACEAGKAQHPFHTWSKALWPVGDRAVLRPRTSAGVKTRESLLNFRDRYGNPIPLVDVFGWKVDYARAKHVLSDIKNGLIGIIRNVLQANKRLDSFYLQKLDSAIDCLKDSKTERVVNVGVVHGWSGSAKSTGLAAWVKRNIDSCRVVTPTTNLRKAWIEDVGCESRNNFRFSTYESALINTAGVLIVDEYYKLPRGMVSLYVAADPAIHTVILLGDPCQAAFDDSHPQSTNKMLSDESDYWKPLTKSYNYYTFRYGGEVAKFLGIPSYCKNQSGKVLLKTTHTNSGGLMVASRGDAALGCDVGVPSLTVNSSQGLTFQQESKVELSKGLLAKASCGVQHVAVTRGKGDLWIYGAKDPVMARWIPFSKIFSALINRQEICALELFPKVMNDVTVFKQPPSPEQLQALRDGVETLSYGVTVTMPKALCDVDVSDYYGYGKSQGAFNTILKKVLRSGRITSDYNTTMDEKFMDDDFLSSNRKALNENFVAPVFSEKTAFDLALESPVIASGCHPHVEVDCFVNANFDYRVWEDVELWHGNEISQQFRGGELLAHYFSDVSQQCPKHSPNDPTLMPLSLPKRVKFTDQVRLTPLDRSFGSKLFSAWQRSYGVQGMQNLEFDEQLFIDCINVNAFNQLTSKSRSVLIANHQRSEPDWRHTYIRLFVKNQQKVSPATIGGPWKAAQTLALMHDSVILCYGPVIKYLEAVMEKFEKPNIFTLGGHTLEQLDDWSRTYVDSEGFHTCGDFSKMDQSEGASVCYMEDNISAWCGIPESLREWYLHLKTNLSCSAGKIDVMRFTGEPGTYRYNTWFTRAVYFYLFDLDPSVVMAHSGDDAYLKGKHLIEGPRWLELKRSLPDLEFKLSHPEYPDFVGFYLSSYGIMRIPTTLFVKTLIAQGKARLRETLPGYILEWRLGELKGDLVYKIMPSEEFDIFLACRSLLWRLANLYERSLLLMHTTTEENVLSVLACDSFFKMFSRIPTWVRIALTRLNSGCTMVNLIRFSQKNKRNHEQLAGIWNSLARAVGLGREHYVDRNLRSWDWDESPVSTRSGRAQFEPASGINRSRQSDARNADNDDRFRCVTRGFTSHLRNLELSGFSKGVRAVSNGPTARGHGHFDAIKERVQSCYGGTHCLEGREFAASHQCSPNTLHRWWNWIHLWRNPRPTAHHDPPIRFNDWSADYDQIAVGSESEASFGNDSSTGAYKH